MHLPRADDPIPPEIATNTHFFPYFEDVVGAMDGVQINTEPSAEDQDSSHNRKGWISQNMLAACSFDMWFLLKE